MSDFAEIIIRAMSEWGIPRTAFHNGWEVPVKLSCSINPPNAINLTRAIPPEIVDFYRYCGGLTFMEDKEYGQWGLNVFSFNVMEYETDKFFFERARDVREGDFIIGRFLGDSELVLVREGDSSSTSVLIVEPLLPRKDWVVAADSFARFLSQFLTEHGRKFWSA